MKLPLRRTSLEAEGFCYPNGAQTRKGVAIYPDGVARRVYAGMPDTYFSIPAHGRYKGRYVAGWIGIDDDGEYVFHIYKEYLDAAQNQV